VDKAVDSLGNFSAEVDAAVAAEVEPEMKKGRFENRPLQTCGEPP
jgi:hypothetical protein